MITVEADVTKTLNEKILPRQQELIPVALKRKYKQAAADLYGPAPSLAYGIHLGHLL